MARRPALILFIAWLGWVFDIMDTALFNFAKKPMLVGFLGEAEYAKVGAAIEGQIQMVFLVGWALGGLIFGVMADRWGRTRTLSLTILLYALLTGLTAFCQSWEQVAVVRFLTALGIGGEWAAGAALVAEVFADEKRPWAAAFLQTAAAVGPGIAALLNLVIRPAWGFQTWQLLFLTGVIPALVAVLVRIMVPEPTVPREEERDPFAQLKALFGDPVYLRRALVIAIIGTVGIAGAGNAAFWLPNLVDQVTPDKALAVIRKSQATWVQHIGTLAGVFFFPLLAKGIGRRWALGMGFGASLAVSFLLIRGIQSWEALLIAAPTLSFFAIGLTAIFGLYFPELFPSRIRATGAGFGYNVARILQSPLPWITGLIIGADNKNPAHGVAMAAGVYVIGILALAFAPETKGKPLPA